MGDDSCNLPSRYGQTRLVLMVRDPHCLFAYWELSEELKTLASLIFDRPWEDMLLTLRVYDVTGLRFDGQNEHLFFDIPLVTQADKWYIHGIKANREYCVDLGAFTIDGKFFVLVRSNSVRTPRDSMAGWGEGELQDMMRYYSGENCGSSSNLIKTD